MNKAIVGIAPIVIVLVLGSIVWQDPLMQNMGHPCTITPNNAEGPYYIPGAPEKDSLGTTLEGTRLVISGQILDYRCNPIPNAVIDIWQTDSNGEYYFDDFTLRGKTFANENGAYSFETVFPGKYSEGGAIRPAHIHVKILSPDGEERITTQLYFEGDEDHDWLVRPSLILETQEIKGTIKSEFDFVIPS